MKAKRAALATTNLSRGSQDKVRDVLSSVLRSAVDYELLVKNPVDGVRLPAQRMGRRKSKPYVAIRKLAGSNSGALCVDGVCGHIHGIAGQ